MSFEHQSVVCEDVVAISDSEEDSCQSAANEVRTFRYIPDFPHDYCVSGNEESYVAPSDINNNVFLKEESNYLVTGLNKSFKPENVEKRVQETHKNLIYYENTENGDKFVLNISDQSRTSEPIKFLHSVDKTTFEDKLDTIAEINLFQLAGFSNAEPFSLQKLKRGGLRQCFKTEIENFKQVHPTSVNELFKNQKEAVRDKSIILPDKTSKNPRPRFKHYKDFITIR